MWNIAESRRASSSSASDSPPRSNVTGDRPRASARVVKMASLTSSATSSIARRQCRRFALGAILEPAQQQRDAGQLLAEPVVQIVADALLLAVADLEHFAFELAARGRVLEHRQPEAFAPQHQRGDGRFDEQHAVAVVRAAHRELAHQRRAGARGGLVGGFGDAPVERGIAGQPVEMSCR